MKLYVKYVSNVTDNFSFFKDMSVVKRKYEEVKGDPKINSAYEENVKREKLQRER